MINSIFKSFVVTSSTVLSLTVINLNSVDAASIFYDFEVNNLDGSLAGQTFPGAFSFEDSSLIGIGEEFLPVSDFSFTFEGIDYTEADLPEVAFFDGDFLGLSFAPNSSFSLVPGFFDVSEAFLAYDLDSGSGTGDINYHLVPEPLTILGAIVAVSFGHFFKRSF